MRSGTDFKGVVGATVTPVTQALEVDSVKLSGHCAALLDAGCAFVSCFGTTGEGASFSAAQKIAALQQMKAAGADMSRHVPGVVAASVDDAATLYRAYAALGCRAALIIPPFYYAPSSEAAVAAFFAAVIEKAGAPDLDIVLYNFPFFSGVTFTPSLVRAVCDVAGGRVIGIKDSTGNLEGGKALIEAFPELSIFTGDDRILSRMVAAGGAGMIGGLVNLFPADSVTLCAGGVDAAFEARAAHRIEAVDGNGGLAALKALLAIRYDDETFLRTMPPLAPLDAALQGRLALELGFAGAEKTA
ncbi:dihydrodipicolinate synthase family protein [Oceanicola sp. S124]|uniref:dihydrodipicolinate synthase family protein n=1 Tax=Oceanicola sp. S124 TaxID=1042378 RepID=UPI0002558670|nr:dihydrodipicolinate synthase family protein [Oceanicola sp. S124]